MVSSRFSLEGKVTVVTGGRQGIGKVVAHALAEQGSDIVIVDLADATDVAAQIAAEHGVRALAMTCNVTDPEEVGRTIEKAAVEMGGLDLLFNNAGIVLHKPALECSPSDFTKVVDVNLNGVFFVAQAFARYLVAQGRTGNIVNTGSMSGTIVNIPQGQASYNASKAAVVHLSKSLAVEWAPLGIRVNSISPGYIQTEMTGTVREDWRQIWTEMIPFKRMGTPEELAGAVIYLLSDASTYTSGADVIIDGCFVTV
ncbi:NAD(P)-dependent dehydrogenase, short-chain alcohol dehydrogenase family [Raineyella antarctica]|uniref:NAD(P)-dependent dehydrogenase, short-chain alcohol dehydrogenase family n=1 Tax=Raineyella antarctica TaxID=1577474 RepID=A0A1G6HQN4_9ACTN|nr:glucose 1-dehydrogenase [Raineyella antarctica]SDB96511.1 NAD(P)-dependent dehydrogenase, short-chain alcohol dehydrogenase family [Raineyella antarctica]